MIRANVRKLALHFILLMAFWLVMSEMFDLFHISLGVLSVITVILINFRLLNHDSSGEPAGRKTGFRLLRLPVYLLYLIAQIVISALKVAYLILHPRMPLKTCISVFKVDLPDMTAKVLLANSITLTPGTITVDITGGNTFVVHSLTSAGDPVWMDHGLAAAVAKLYGADPEKVVSDEVIINSKDKLDAWTCS